MSETEWNDVFFDLCMAGAADESRPTRSRLAAHMARLEERLESLETVLREVVGPPMQAGDTWAEDLKAFRERVDARHRAEAGKSEGYAWTGNEP